MARYRTVQEVTKETMQLAQEIYARKRMAAPLEKIGILLGEDGKVPMSGDVPRVFAMKDGKAVTLEEGGMKIDSPAFIEALMKGQIFAYPNGGTAPVQLRASAKQDKDMPEPEFRVQITDPLSAPDPRDNLRPEPAAKPAPKWYHRVFSFIPSNRRRIDEYTQYREDHAAWEQEKQQAQEEYEASANKDEIDVISAAAEKFGAKRDEKSLEADKVMQEQVDRNAIDRQADQMESREIDAVESGIEVMVNIYSTHPEAKTEWLKKFPTDNSGYYMKEDFDKLKTLNFNPERVQIGDKALTEREFATIAMFAATSEEISLEQQKVAVNDPAPSIDTLQKAGYTEAQARRLAADANNTNITVDMLRRDRRLYKTIDPAANAGRDLAMKALAVYPARKEALAEILGRAVVHAGVYAGPTRDTGALAAVKLAGEMLDLMERDPELKEMAKKSFDRREQEYCADSRIPRKKFDDLAGDIRKRMKFEEVRQKGVEGRVKLLRARAQGRELTPEQKKGCVRDILAANLTEALRLNQVGKSESEPASAEGQPFNANSMMNEYLRLMKFEAGGGGLGATAGGSTMASSASAFLTSALQQRVVKTPNVLTTVTKPAEMEKMMKTVDKIIEADHLADRSVDDLVKTVANPENAAYENDKMMDKAVKAEKGAIEAQKQTNTPARDLQTEKKVEAPQAAAPQL